MCRLYFSILGTNYKENQSPTINGRWIDTIEKDLEFRKS